VVLDEETLKHGDVAGVQELIEGAVV